jgi:archaeal flagellin N-terminal-like domain
MKTKTRGLEPIVAAVLLIMVAVIGAVLVYLWFAGYVTKATSQAESMAASEKLKIEAASLTAAGDGSGTATLYIRNLGGDAMKVVQAYVFKPGSTNVLCTISIVADPYSWAVVNITPALPAGCGITAGYDYVMKIFTQKGTKIAVTVTTS